MAESSAPWWRDAVMYQVYLRSFADGTGDGIGDLPGVRARLPYLRDLGVDGLWLTPWYPSPMKDGGYDVADYTDIEPLFGTLEDARGAGRRRARAGPEGDRRLRGQPHLRRASVVPAALAAAPGSDERARYHFRDGRGEHGEQPPNDWISAFGGPAWTRVTEPDGTPGQWYLHLFAPAQPDLNWDHAGVRADMADMLRFWFDFGLDGLRMDAASGLAKEPGPARLRLPGRRPLHAGDLGGRAAVGRGGGARHPARVAGDRRLLPGRPDSTSARWWSTAPSGWPATCGPDELHTTFNLDFLKSPLEPGAAAAAPSRTRWPPSHSVGAPADLDAVQPRRDPARHPLRPGLDRRAAAAAVAVPGVGPRARHPAGPGHAAPAARPARLGVPLPGRGARPVGGRGPGRRAHRRPGLGELAAHRIRGRDGCRVPMPWSGDRAAVRLHRGYAVAAPAGGVAGLHRRGRRSSARTRCWHYYRAALAARRTLAADMAPTLTWLGGPDGVLAFSPRQLRLHGQPLRPAGAGDRTGAAEQRAGASTGWCRREVAVWTSGLPGADQAAQHTVHEGR